MLEKTVVVSQIEVNELNIVQVRTSTRISDNGQKVSETYHRHCVLPGSDYSQEDARVRAICAAVHTPEVVANYLTVQELGSIRSAPCLKP